MIKVAFLIAFLFYWWAGYQFLILDASFGDLWREFPPIIIFLGWPLFLCWYLLVYLWENWFTLNK